LEIISATNKAMMNETVNSLPVIPHKTFKELYINAIFQIVIIRIITIMNDTNLNRIIWFLSISMKSVDLVHKSAIPNNNIGAFAKVIVPKISIKRKFWEIIRPAIYIASATKILLE
jgi:hypothetical protein